MEEKRKLFDWNEGVERRRGEVIEKCRFMRNERIQKLVAEFSMEMPLRYGPRGCYVLHTECAQWVEIVSFGSHNKKRKWRDGTDHDVYDQTLVARSFQAISYPAPSTPLYMDPTVIRNYDQQLKKRRRDLRSVAEVFYPRPEVDFQVGWHIHFHVYRDHNDSGQAVHPEYYSGTISTDGSMMRLSAYWPAEKSHRDGLLFYWHE